MSDQPRVDLHVQLAAFLAGELDEAASTALQDRIDAEPWVARLADELADTLVSLGAVDEVEPPNGYSDRLRARLAEEIGHELPAAPAPHDTVADPALAGATALAGAAAATGWAERDRPSTPRSSSGPGRGGRSRAQRLRPALVAAALVLLTVVGIGALTSSGFLGSSDDSSADFSSGEVAMDQAEESTRAAGPQAESLQAPTADEGAATTADDGSTATTADVEGAVPAADDAADEAAADSAAGMAAPAAGDTAGTADSSAGGNELAATGPQQEGPQTLDLGAVDDDSDAAILDLLGRVPAVEALLGTPQADAAELSSTYRDEILRGPDFADGTRAGQCLVEVLQQAGGDRVPAVAARLDLPDGPVLGYTLVRSRGGEALDTTDVWLLDLDSCGLRRVVSDT